MPSPSRLRAAFAAPRPIHRALLFAGGLLLLFLAIQLAPTGPSTPAEATALDNYETVRPQRDGVGLFSVGNLIALALLTGGGAWALYLRKRSTGPGNAPALFESMGQMQIAAGQQLRLVRCGGEVLLLGVTSGQITLLRRYAVEAFETKAPGIASDDTLMPPGFAELLRTSLGRPTHA